jgi:hypothetical protein
VVCSEGIYQLRDIAVDMPRKLQYGVALRALEVSKIVRAQLCMAQNASEYISHKSIETKIGEI